MKVGNAGSPGAVTVINGQMPAGASMGNQDSPGGVFIYNSSDFLNGPPSWEIKAGNNRGSSYVDIRGGVMRGVSIGSNVPTGSNRSVNAGSIAPGAVITTGDGNTIVPSPRAQGFQKGSMGQTPVAAYPVRPQPAAANQQQGGYSQRQTTAPVNQPETLSQRFGNVFKNTAGYGLVAVAASGGALLAPVAVAAVAVIAAYKAIQALEAVMNLFKRDKPQGQGQTGQQAQTPVAQATTARALHQEHQSSPASQVQQPSPALETAGNANGGTTGIQFTQDVSLGGVDAPSAGFNMDTVAQALAAARGGR